jgi:outer membrane protein assembly factor BamB
MNPPHRRILVWSLLLAAASAEAADWPQFLGPSRSGSAADSEAALPDAFEKEPTVLWSHAVGSGHAGPVVSQGKLIVFHRVGDESIIDALDAVTGKKIWQQRLATDYRDDFGMDNGPRAVPTVADNRVLVHGADGVLSALRLDTGDLLWSLDTKAEQQSPQGFFGRVCAPLVVGDKVLLSTGGSAAMTAFEVATGQMIWTAGDDEASYASPVMLNESVVLAWLRNHLTTFSLADGRVLDRAKLRPSIQASVSAATPVLTSAGWFITAEYDLGASLWEIATDGKLTQRWAESDLLNAHYATPVHHDGHIYGFDGRQERGMTLRCLSLADRAVCWQSPSVPGGTLLRVKDKLLVLTEDGELWVVRATPNEFDQILTTQVLRAGHRSYAAYANGIWYARDAETLVAVRVLSQ